MKRLLIVDDEPFVRDALKRVLEEESLIVAVAADATAALAELQSEPYDLVIVDVIMPGMDGVELIRRIRTQCPAARVVAISGGGNFELSGYGPDAVTTRAYLAAASSVGADGVLTKPFETAELDALIRPLLR